MAPSIKLTYFDFDGLGETARLLLSYGGIAFEDNTVQSADWPALKSKMPFGQMPVLEVDGKQLAQSGAVNRHCAALAGLVPSDAWHAAQAEQAVSVMADVWSGFAGSWFALPADARTPEKAKELFAAVSPKADNLEKLLAAVPEGAFLTGPEPSWADLHLFVTLSTLTGGLFKGLFPEILAPYPATVAFHARVGRLDKVRAHYLAQGDKRAAIYRP